MSIFKYFTKINVKHVRPVDTVRVQYQGLEAKTTEVEARVALICASTDNGRPLLGGLNLIQTVVDWVASDSGHMHNLRHSNARSLVHDFSVKLSPCMCSHVSCPGCLYM